MGRVRTSRIWELSRAELEALIQESESVSDLLRKIGMEPGTGGNHRTLKARCNEEGIDLSELQRRGSRVSGEKLKLSNQLTAIPLEQILVENSTYTTTSTLKARLLKEGVIEEKCVGCGQGPEWMGKPLTLTLDHINGKNRDHRLINLRLLCPNCNSQTPTFSGRNKPKKVLPKCSSCGTDLAKGSSATYCKKCVQARKVENRPSPEEIAVMRQNMSWTAIGKRYGVTHGSVKKWAKEDKMT